MEEKTFIMKLGYSRMDVTPDDSVPLAGYGNSSFRMSTEVMDPIYTTAIALSDGEHTAIIIENDLTTSAKPITDEVRQRVSRETGVPMENIMVACIHLHSAPDQWNTKEPSQVRYNGFLVDTMVKNALAAVVDMSPATARLGVDRVEGLNYVRHYVLEDGHVRGPSFGLQYKSPKVAHTHEPDRQMQVVAFSREGKEDVVLVNFQAHPQIATINHRNSITADTVGVMRRLVEDKLGCKVFYVLGASGDLQAISLIKEENRFADHVEYGMAFGAVVEKTLLGEMTALPLGRLKVIKRVFAAQTQKADAQKLAKAKEIFDQWQQDNDYPAAVKAGEAIGINSPYHANAIIRQTELPEEEELELYAMSFGALAFVFAPYEMFCQSGIYIKGHAPFVATFVCTLANRSMCYLPTKAAFDYNCYEANTCRYIRGTAEALAEEFAQMLDKI